MDHGGDIDRAMVQYGGEADDWIDLSTGINRRPYPVPDINPKAWQNLPTASDMRALCDAARAYYGTKGAVAALAGAQSAIQLLPQIAPRGRMRIIGPTYNEYEAVFRRAGWKVDVVPDLAGLHGADIAILVNPNNPDGRRWLPDDLIALTAQVGLLIVDESFMDMTPDHSLAKRDLPDGIVVLRSFGKFFGLAGLRLGFVLGDHEICGWFQDQAGPWPVAGPAVDIACAALADTGWISRTRQTLARTTKELDTLVPWPAVGGTHLFRLFNVGDAVTVQKALACCHIWTRRFPWNAQLLRIGAPTSDDIVHLKAALALV